MEYFLTRKNVKNVNLRICADGSVRVSANPRIAVSRTDAFVREKGEWVLRKKEEFARRAAQKNETTVCDGAKTLFLGREYVLRIIAANKKSVSISEDGDEIEIRIPDTADLQLAEKTLVRWYAARAAEILPELFRSAERETQGYFGAPCILRLRRMRARWGSCNAATRTVTLKPRLFTLRGSAYGTLRCTNSATFTCPRTTELFTLFSASSVPTGKPCENG